MKYRIRLQLTFRDEATARVVVKAIRDHRSLFDPLPDDFIQIHKCYHDQPEPEACEVIWEWHAS